MKRFTWTLVVTFTGVVFAGFLTAYFLFNALVDNHIRSEAERELASGIVNVVDRSAQITEFVPTNIRVMSGIMGGTEGGIIHMGGEFTNNHIVFGSINVEGEFADSPVIFHLHQLDMPQPVRRSIVTADVIMIDQDNEIILPWMDILPEAQSAEINLLASHYVSNRSHFQNEEMVMFTTGDRTYYLKAMSQLINEETVSILMYTDVSSVIAFRESMNQRLLILLILSGILGLVISVVLSNRFKLAIEKLSQYAEVIGHGKFNEDAGVFKYSEFDTLSKSMVNMAAMLQSYESNQKQFFQNASHELRTPLMSIQGYAEGLVADVFEKEEAAQIILAEGEKMADLVSSLLYISRIDSGLETPGNIASIDVRNLLYDCHERVKVIAEKAGKRIHVDVEAATIAADAEKLERAIINILSNGIRHAESVIEIQCKVDGDVVKITISDDGQGIDDRDLPHIFERFYKGENGNSGLGLAIAKDIITSHGGQITAENLNTQKKKSQFVIELPL